MAARAYRHQEFAEKPAGWRVRSKRAGDHVLRIAFPPGRRRRGAGRLLEILHPKRNPACEDGSCDVSRKNPEELLLFVNPSDPQAHEKLFDCPHCKEKFTPAEVEEGKFRKHMAEHRAERFGNPSQGFEEGKKAGHADGYIGNDRLLRSAESMKGSREPYTRDYARGYVQGYREGRSEAKRHGNPTKVAPGDHVTFHGYDGKDYSARVTEVKRGVAVIKYPVPGHSEEVTAYINRKDWRRRFNPSTKAHKKFERSEEAYLFADQMRAKYPGRKVDVRERSDGSWEVFVHNPLSKTYDIWEITPSDETHRMYHDLPRAEAKRKLDEVRKRTEGSGWRYIMKRFQENPRAAGGVGNHRPGCNCKFCRTVRKAQKNAPSSNPSARRRAIKMYRRMHDATRSHAYRDRIRMQLARLNAKQGWTMADVASFAGHSPTRIRRNPSEETEAVRLFESFHGHDPEEIVETQASAAMRLDYTGLGELVKLKTDIMEINFESDDVVLASSPNGKQLYAIDGNQNMDKMLSEAGVDLSKDFIDCGEVKVVEYLARKIHGGYEPTVYVHKLGEETGERPFLMYDKLKKQIFFVGGAYYIDTSKGISPGIEN